MTIKRLFVFDLDDTLGWKSPQYPDITRENADYLRYLSKDESNLVTIATSRPRSLTIRGFQNAGMNHEEFDSIFPVCVYEDGFFVQVTRETLFDAGYSAGPIFSELKDIYYGDDTIDFFKKNGILLIPDADVIYKNGLYYMKKFGHEEAVPIAVPEDLRTINNEKLVIQGQDNEVKQVYRSIEGLLDDDLNRQAPLFEEVGRLTEQNLSTRVPNWKDVADLVVWKDAVDLYPRLGDDLYLKGHGLQIALSEYHIPDNVQVYICADGKNDISMAKWAQQRFRNTLVVCPSNVSSDLIECLRSEKIPHRVLREDCTQFTEGLDKLVI